MIWDFLFSTNLARNRQGFNDAIVFMIGGGNYIEYQNLQDYAKNRSTISTKRIVYGCTELVNASQFLEQVIRRNFFYRIIKEFVFSLQNWANNKHLIHQTFIFHGLFIVNKLF
jgi:hypothetical protein